VVGRTCLRPGCRDPAGSGSGSTNRFWTFQTIETALFVVLAVALAEVCAWWIRHRIN
jgi:hypothetical protein